MAKYLITGAAGFIGSHLAERLIAEGHDVLGIDCFTDYYSKAQKMLNRNLVSDKGVEFLHIDLAEDDLSTALEGVEAIYHLAAQPGISATTPFDAYLKNNLIGTYRLLDATKKSDSLRGFINISTSSVYGADATSDENAEPKPTSYYGVTKLAAEQLILAAAREEDFPACSMRLFSVYGPRERPEKLYPRLIASILEDKAFPLYAGSKEHLRSYTYVDDIIDGLVSLLDKLDEIKGEIFNIGTDVAITTAEGIKIVEEIIGKKAKIDPKPKRPGDQLKTHANITKARRILGYKPTTTAREGLEKE
ncbi:MAG: NAD-dependent epimerase/dehydratase family protein, partial [Anaerolineae bacterium]|nr:NAD-dependent epimerase/dehydratase family protein [Anaerolineae bacterium]